MKKELQKYIRVSDEIANHPLNKHLNLIAGSFIPSNGDTKTQGSEEGGDCPPDTAEGYWDKSSGHCIFIPYS